jgi:hypothetical protein
MLHRIIYSTMCVSLVVNYVSFYSIYFGMHAQQCKGIYNQSLVVTT